MQAALVEDVRVGAAAGRAAGVVAAALERLQAPHHAGRRGGAVGPYSSVADRLDARTPRRSPRAPSRRASPGSPWRALGVERARLGAASSGRHDVARRPAADRCRRWRSSRRRSGRAASRRSPARRRRSRCGPAPARCRRARAAVERGVDRVLARARGDDPADRRGVVVDEADARVQPRGVEGLGAEQADLLLHASARARCPRAGGPRRRSGGRRRASPRRPPCCRRRGSRRAFVRCRPRRPARSAPSAGPCRCGRRSRIGVPPRDRGRDAAVEVARRRRAAAASSSSGSRPSSRRYATQRSAAARSLPEGSGRGQLEEQAEGAGSRLDRARSCRGARALACTPLQRGADEVAEQRVRPRRARLELGVELGGHEARVVGSSIISTRSLAANTPETRRPAASSCGRRWLLTS